MHTIFSRAARTRRSRLLIQMLLDETQPSAKETPPRTSARSPKLDSTGGDAPPRPEVRGFRIVGLTDDD